MSDFNSENKITYEELAPSLQNKLKNTVTSDDLSQITQEVKDLTEKLSGLLKAYIKKDELYEAMHRYNDTIPENFVPPANTDDGWNGVLNKTAGFYIASYNTGGKFANQPTNKGQLINIPASKSSKYSTQLWIDQDTGRLYTRSSSNGNLNSTKFTKVLNENDMIVPYKVGDILISLSPNDPSATFPGTTWRRIYDRFLLAMDAKTTATVDPTSSTYTGGSSTHKNTLEELAPHTHSFSGTTNTASLVGKWSSVTSGDSSVYGSYGWSRSGIVGVESSYGEATSSGGSSTTGRNFVINASHTHTCTGTAGSTGSGKEYSIMPPYLKVYVWYRVS